MGVRRARRRGGVLAAVFVAMVVSAGFVLAAPPAATGGASRRTAPPPRVQPAAPAVVGPRATGRRVLPRAAALPLRTTEAEILEDHGPDFRYWRSEMVLELSDNEFLMTRPVRWRTKLSSVKSAVWQVSLFPYGEKEKDWRDPPGLMASGTTTDLPAPGGNAEFRVAFLKFAPGAPQRVVAPATQPGSAHVVPLSPAAQPSAAPSGRVANPDLRRRGAGPGTAPPRTVSASHARLVRAKAFTYPTALKVILQQALPIRYYLRVVTLGANGQPVGAPSAAIVVTLDKPQPLPDEVAKALAMDGKHPAARLISYTPLREQASDARYHVIVTQDIPDYTSVPGWGGGGMFSGGEKKLLYYKGQKLDLTPPPYHAPSAWEQFLSDVGSTGDYFANIVNSVSNAYDWVKRTLISTLLPEELRGPALAALDVGLVALGVPPSLPNFSELTSMGADYLVAEVADQAGVSPELAQQVVHGVVDATRKAENGEGSPPSWLKPDPDYQFRLATLVIQVSNPGTEPTDPVTLQIRTKGKDRDLFLSQAVPVPPIAPGQTMRIPVCLTKNIRMDAAGSHVDEWQQEYYTGGQMRLEAWTEWQQGGYFAKRHVFVDETIATTKVHYGKGVIPPTPHHNK